MSNVLDHSKQQQILALGRLGWTLLAHPAGDGRPTADDQRLLEGRRYSGVGPRPAERIETKTSNSGAEVSTDPHPSKPAISEAVFTDSGEAKPATRAEMSTDSDAISRPTRAPSASACEPHRELIAEALRRGATR